MLARAHVPTQRGIRRAFAFAIHACRAALSLVVGMRGIICLLCAAALGQVQQPVSLAVLCQPRYRARRDDDVLCGSGRPGVKSL